MNSLVNIPVKTPTLISKTIGGSKLPSPFGREILLAEVEIAGTYYYDFPAISDELEAGQDVKFQREPHNDYDEDAIAIYDLNDHKLGYVPRRDNSVLAALLDAGKTLSGRLANAPRLDPCGAVDVRVYLQDA